MEHLKNSTVISLTSNIINTNVQFFFCFLTKVKRKTMLKYRYTMKVVPIVIFLICNFLQNVKTEKMFQNEKERKMQISCHHCFHQPIKHLN